MSESFKGRHVVITGAGGGLGPAVVRAFAAAGAVCHTPSRSELDLNDEQAVRAYYAGLPDLWASVHVAGGFAAGRIEDTSLEDFLGQWRINTATAFLASREAVRKIRASMYGGRVVNVASRAAVEPGPGKIAYVTAKAGLVALTKALAVETKGDGIWVNAVLPDTMDTPANRAAMPDVDPATWTPTETVARTIVWLASSDNQSVTGALVPV